MRISRAFATALFALSSIAPALCAQQGFFRPPEIQGAWKPVVGSGASYESQSSSGEKSILDVFIVGKESVSGKEAYWVEIVKRDSSSDSAPSFIMKSLCTFESGTLQVSRAIVQIGGNTIELPIQNSSETALTVDIRSKGQKVGMETIATPAGKFPSEHWRSEDGGDFWISENITPYGLVKSSNKDGGGLTLLKRISNAKDRIPGTPKSPNAGN